MKLSKEEAVKKVVYSAKEYKTELSASKYLLVCQNINDKRLECFEIQFPKYAFLHLTGLAIAKNSTIKSANDFFEACISNKLSHKDIDIGDENNVSRKLQVLPQLIHFAKYSKMSVVFNGGRPLLKCDKVVGTTNFCVALKQNNNFYIPVSCLNEDVRNFGNEVYRVISIFQTEKNSNTYSNIRYVAKGIDLTSLSIPTNENITIDLSNYKK